MAENRRNTIEKITLPYTLLRVTARFYFMQFYKKIYVYGKNNIPYDHPIIFAPNHQGAVMDPLAILFTQKLATVFLARSDVFKGKRLVNLLTFLKILPVYRQRDGVENLAKNEDIFNITVRVLKNKRPVCLMPEGSHGNKNNLRPLVKGLFRIAFSAQDNLMDKSKGVMIVPVGLYYEDYVKINKRMVVNYGKPIPVEEYYDLYKEKSALAINKLKEKLSSSLSECMINIKDNEQYEAVNFLQKEYPKYIKNHRESNYFTIRKKLTDAFNNASDKKLIFLPQLVYFVSEYIDILNKNKLRDWVVAKRNYSFFTIISSWIALLLLFPFFLYGLIINWIPFWLPVKPTKKIKDKQFHSSVKYVLSIIIFTLYYLMITTVVGFIAHSVIVALVFLVLSPICGYLSLHTYYIYKKTVTKMKFKRLKRKKHPDFYNLISLRKKFMSLTDFVYKYF